MLSLAKIYLISARVSFAQATSLIKSAFVNRMIKPARKVDRVEIVIARSVATRQSDLLRLPFKAVAWLCQSISFISRYNKESIESCLRLFDDCLVPEKIKDVAVFGINDIAKIIVLIANDRGIKITGVYDNVGGIRFSGHIVSHYTGLKDYPGKIIISSSLNTEEKARKLKSLGIKDEDILLWNSKIILPVGQGFSPA